MQARTLLSLTAALLMTGGILSIFQLPAAPAAVPAQQARVSRIDGIPVVDLPGITVRPTAAEVRAALAPARGQAIGAALLQGLTGNNGTASALGSHLTMPYYSFGSELGQISKD